MPGDIAGAGILPVRFNQGEMMTAHTPGPWKLSEYQKMSATDEGEWYIGVGTDYPPALCNGARSITTMTGCYYTRRTQPEHAEAMDADHADLRRADDVTMDK